MMDSIQPSTFVKVKDQNGNDKYVNAQKITSIETLNKAVVMKDNNERVIARIEDSRQKPAEIANQLGNVIDLVG